jgi:topoisomerase-4 subunit A
MRPITTADVEHLLEIRIKRISRYDLNKQEKEIKDIRKRIKEISKSLKDMTQFTIEFLDDVLRKYGHLYPRRSELKEFSEVSARSVAISNLLTVYNRQSGFLGHQIKEEHPGEDIVVACSEYDRLFLIFMDGTYKVIPVTEKLYVGSDMLWFGVVEKELVFNVIYRDGAENLAYIKRFHMPSFILDKEYRLFPEHKRSKILYLDFGKNKRVKISLVPSLRAKSNSLDIIFDNFLIKNVAAKGKRLANRGIRRILPLDGKSELPEQKNLSLPGLSPTKSQEHDAADGRKNGEDDEEDR